jgi:hypothetical protein
MTATAVEPSVSTKVETAMQYPIKGVDGGTFDRAIPRKCLDPFYDHCPPWCDDAGTGHRIVESCDDDRTHWGERIGIPIRSLTLETPELGDGQYILRTAELYLKRNVLHREPQIWLGQDESNGGFELSLCEADQLAHVLSALVAQGRGSAAMTATSGAYEGSTA